MRLFELTPIITILIADNEAAGMRCSQQGGGFLNLFNFESVSHIAEAKFYRKMNHLVSYLRSVNKGPFNLSR